MGFSHQVHEDGCTILKVGEDAVTVGVVDIWWDDTGAMHSSHQLIKTEGFEPDAKTAAMVQ